MIIAGNSPRLVFVFSLANPIAKFDQTGLLAVFKKNTEQPRAVFDSQPSQQPGNSHRGTIPSEPGIGYLSAGVVAQLGFLSIPHNYTS